MVLRPTRQKRTRLMSMDESVKLQNENQQRIKASLNDATECNDVLTAVAHQDEQLRRKAESIKSRAQTSESLADDLRYSATHLHSSMHLLIRFFDPV